METGEGALPNRHRAEPYKHIRSKQIPWQIDGSMELMPPAEVGKEPEFWVESCLWSQELASFGLLGLELPCMGYF